MKPSTILFILAGICLAPGLVLCYIAVFGGNISEIQAYGAFVLGVLGLIPVVTAAALASDGE